VTAACLPDTGHGAAVSVAVQRAMRVLLACQDQAGWWPDRADSDASSAAEALLVRWFLHAGAAPGQGAAELIRSGQRPDGSWAGAEPGATADLSASVLCYLALARHRRRCPGMAGAVGRHRVGGRARSRS